MPLADPGFVVSAVRRLTIPAIHYFHVTTGPVPSSELDAVLDQLIGDLHAAIDGAGLGQVRDDLLRHYGLAAPGRADETATRVMEIGVPVPEGTPPSGKALVKLLPEFACAGVLVWGGFECVSHGYDTLTGYAREAGLNPSGEWREWYFNVDDADSAQNVIGLYMGIV